MLKAILCVSAFLSIGIVNGQNNVKNTSTLATRSYPTPSLTAEMQQFAVEHGSYIVDIPSSKEIVFDGEITLEIAQKIDPKKMGIDILDRGQFFKITGTDRMLIVKSTWVLDNEMKTTKK